MSHADEAWDDLLFGRGEEDEGVKCRFCGETSLHWEKTSSGKFRLADENGNLHTCDRNEHV